MDEESTKSDEEYDDLAMEDKSYWTDNEEEESRDTISMVSENNYKEATRPNKDDKYIQNLDIFLKIPNQPLTEFGCRETRFNHR